MEDKKKWKYRLSTGLIVSSRASGVVKIWHTASAGIDGLSSSLTSMIVSEEVVNRDSFRDFGVMSLASTSLFFLDPARGPRITSFQKAKYT
jgi:hypothetical protein